MEKHLTLTLNQFLQHIYNQQHHIKGINEIYLKNKLHKVILSYSKQYFPPIVQIITIK